jgi:hypothetical protein
VANELVFGVLDQPLSQAAIKNIDGGTGTEIPEKVVAGHAEESICEEVIEIGDADASLEVYPLVETLIAS